MEDDEIYMRAAHAPVDWFRTGFFPSCSCGFAPNENGSLNDHWGSFGLRYVADGLEVLAFSTEQEG